MKLSKLFVLFSCLPLLVGCKASDKGNSDENTLPSSVEIFTNNDSWKGAFSGGSGFVDALPTTDNSKNRERLVTYFNKDFNFVGSFTCEGAITSLNYGEMDPEDNKKNLGVGLAIGGGSKIGTMTISFSQKPSKVTVYGLAYYKKYKTYPGDPYNGLSKDTDSELILKSGEATSSVDLRGTDPLEIKTVETNISGDKLVIQNASDDKGRVIIDKIVFSF